MVIYRLTIVVGSDDDEDDVMDLCIYDIHDKRSLTPET